MAEDVRIELQNRLEVWRTIKSEGGPDGLIPQRIRSLGIHRGQQGIFRDQVRTSHLTHSGTGVAVGLLHTGRVYSDALSDDGLTYHYPSTIRGRRDHNEVESIMACRELGLPLFVIIKPHPTARTRNVRLGWVRERDEQLGLILISFGDVAPERPVAGADQLDSTPFVLQQRQSSRRGTTKTRPGQAEFRFDVLRRYGAECTVCRIAHQDLLHAAHICPVEASGCDDARNGIVLCLTHHRAFDKGLFRIDPDTTVIFPAGGARALADIGVVRAALSHLPRLPHPTALRWHSDRAGSTDASHGTR